MTDDLVKFLQARLQDDEHYARNAFGEHNDAGPNWYEQWSGALNIGEAEDLILTNDSAVSRFMARHDPARVLAEVKAKRQIVETAQSVWNSDAEGVFGQGETILQLLALPYADHPDYREDWRP